MKHSEHINPIGFNPRMAHAIISGKKTQTRRPIKGIEPWLKDPKDFYETPKEKRPIFSEPIAKQEANHWLWSDQEHPEKKINFSCPFGIPGSRLFVQETWAVLPTLDSLQASELEPDTIKNNINYRADWHRSSPWARTKWRDLKSMPFWASRAILNITNIRIQRLQEIDYEDIIAEGVPGPGMVPGKTIKECERKLNFAIFADIWDDIYRNKHLDWIPNPWVWVLTFQKV